MLHLHDVLQLFMRSVQSLHTFDIRSHCIAFLVSSEGAPEGLQLRVFLNVYLLCSLLHFRFKEFPRILTSNKSLLTQEGGQQGSPISYGEQPPYQVVDGVLTLWVPQSPRIDCSSSACNLFIESKDSSFFSCIASYRSVAALKRSARGISSPSPVSSGEFV
mmetsp:Transcript_10607/g.44207  ORF Transcript_10607/g.44207 Transcript_10607/m.44207 type:complete len:161 (+) Transcript_10607:587-1069(+)